jgi:hypothetical protein
MAFLWHLPALIDRGSPLQPSTSSGPWRAHVDVLNERQKLIALDRDPRGRAGVFETSLGFPAQADLGSGATGGSDP